MTPHPLNRLIALILALALAIMGVAAASAKGQTTIGGHALAHCSAGGLVQPTLDAKGKPTGARHLCPDLAAGLLAASALVPATVAAPAGILLSGPAVQAAPIPAGSPGSAAQARGPPVSP